MFYREFLQIFLVTTQKIYGWLVLAIASTLSFFYKQPVSKQLALGWQIAKQLSGLNFLSLSNNENYKLKKSGVFTL